MGVLREVDEHPALPQLVVDGTVDAERIVELLLGLVEGVGVDERRLDEHARALELVRAVQRMGAAVVSSGLRQVEGQRTVTGELEEPPCAVRNTSLVCRASRR